MLICNCRVLEQVNFEKKFSSLPEFKPEECQSPSAISVPSSPRVFVQNYRKKQSSCAQTPQMIHLITTTAPSSATPLGSGGSISISTRQQQQLVSSMNNISCDDDDNILTPFQSEQRNNGTVAITPKSSTGGTKLVGNTFFGPDFNLEAVRDTVNTDGGAEPGHSPCTPKTPCTATGIISSSGMRITTTSGESATDKGHRRLLEQRRQLVMQLFQEQGCLFPSTQATSNFQVCLRLYY